MTNYQSMVNRISNSKDEKSISKTLDNLFLNGVFTKSEFQRLDSKIVDKYPKT